MKVQNIIKALEEWAPLSHAEDFDNVGLQIGNPENQISKALVAFEITEEVMQEAITEKAGLIITFHPLIFGGLKSITEKNRVEKMVVKAIKNDISVYAIHTNIDAQIHGVNNRICKAIGLENNKILIPKKDNLFKLVFFVPEKDAEQVKEALYKKGIGKIGNYAECSFSSQGKGSFKPIKGARPHIGNLGEREELEETRVEMLVQRDMLSVAITSLKQNHPYEEVAYDLIPLANLDTTLGMGQVGTLKTPMEEKEFLEHLKKQLPTACIRHSQFCNKNIRKVAVLGGSGAFAIEKAKSIGADVLVTADLKYHDFFAAEGRILLCDIGHYESEQYNKFHITDYLLEKFHNFAVITSKCNTNPVNYF